MNSIFSKIISREIPAYIIAENDQFIAFLDVNPSTKGHTLVIPKVEIEYIFDLENDVYGELFAFAKTISIALKKATSCKKVGLAVFGFDVAHTHIHLIPMNTASDFGFSILKLTFSEEEFLEIKDSIKSYLV